jgi:2,3-bisphosphoglycerate-independent phosphoglycerate mutase
MTRLPAALIILDGVGVAPAGPGNAITLADTPHLDALAAEWPSTTLEASGHAVGLPDSQMGNSEVGHLNIGAGRVVYQELTRISMAIEDGSFFDNPVLVSALDAAVERGGAVHLLGLVSDGGVHSHQEHLYALLRMARRRGAERVFVHALLDGRDVPPRSGLGYVEQLEAVMRGEGVGTVATIMGRYYAMDRDSRWNRVERAWQAMVLGEGIRAEDATSAIRASYAESVTDEFMEPTVVQREGQPVARVSDGDTVVFFNFRPDRAREITRAFVDPMFVAFERPAFPQIDFVCLTEYDPTIPASVAFAKELPCCVLADVLSESGLRQLHIAETEKYAHVTFFLNGGVEDPKPGESRILVPSPRVATYDKQPEMSAPEVTRQLVAAVEADAADVYIVNYANGDMVGHTGDLDAAIEAMETVDDSVGAVVAAVRAKGGGVLLTADHGNAEEMLEQDESSPVTAHSVSRVPFIVVADGVSSLADGGILADVAPTLVDLIGVEAPPEWTGRSLLVY